MQESVSIGSVIYYLPSLYTFILSTWLFGFFTVLIQVFLDWINTFLACSDQWVKFCLKKITPKLFGTDKKIEGKKDFQIKLMYQTFHLIFIFLYNMPRQDMAWNFKINDSFCFLAGLPQVAKSKNFTSFNAFFN